MVGGKQWDGRKVVILVKRVCEMTSARSSVK